MHDNDKMSARAPPQPPSWKAVREGSLRSTLHAPQGQGGLCVRRSLNPITGYNDVCLGTSTWAQAAREHGWIKTLYNTLFSITCAAGARAAVRSESAVLEQMNIIFRSKKGWKIYAVDMRHGDNTEKDQKIMIPSRVYCAASYLAQAHVTFPSRRLGKLLGPLAGRAQSH